MTHQCTCGELKQQVEESKKRIHDLEHRVSGIEKKLLDVPGAESEQDRDKLLDMRAGLNDIVRETGWIAADLETNLRTVKEVQSDALKRIAELDVLLHPRG